MSEPPPIVFDPTHEVGYAAQRGGLLVIGKHSAEAVGETLGKGLQTALTPGAANHVATGAGAISGLGGLLTIGLAAGVSAALTQMDYLHRKDAIKDMYKEELSAKLDKPINKLNRNDLDTLAKNNAVIKEELRRSSRQRYFGVALSFVASMASLAAIMIALPAVVGLATGVTAAVAAHSSPLLIGFGGFLVKAVVGLATYNTVKAPLHWAADKLFGIDDPTTNDRIVAIKRDRHAGKAISREQVMSVFVASNPQLDKYIVQEYGKHYDDLSLDDKKQVVQELSQHLPLERLTLEINSGKVNPTELAFAVEGQESGVDHLINPAAQEKRGLLSVMWEKVSNKAKGKPAFDAHEYVTPLTGMAQQALTVYENEKSQPNFVDRLGLAKKDPSLGHAQRVDQGRNEPATPGIPQP